MRYLLEQGDITRVDVEAIVNAANSTLLGGGGVDGQFTGTTGGRLPARFVIHTVGPVWQGGAKGEPARLADCYRNSLRVALENGLKGVAFPSISTGVFGYPIELAAPIAVATVREFSEGLEEVRFVSFPPETAWFTRSWFDLVFVRRPVILS